MEWERAKSYILVFFLLLNIALGVMLFIEDRRYTLTPDQEQLIRTVLSQNGITMDAVPLQRFPPMRQIEVTGFYYDIDALLDIFFPNPGGVVRSHQFGADIFQYGIRHMSISNGFIFFDDPTGYMANPNPPPFTEDWAISLADSFIQDHFPDFWQDSIIYTEEGLRIIYRQMYSGVLVHSNFVEFLITPIGIRQVEMQFGEIIGHTGTPVSIFSPDEALVSFVQRVRHLAMAEPMTIRFMDLVYFQEYVSDQDYVYIAVPFYRIFTACGDGRPFLVNAFTNVIID